jgi:mannose-6-phosphate isomerase-like protein (cupin superfamily)
MRLQSTIVAALVLAPCAVATAFAARRPAATIDYVPAYRFEQIRGFAKAMGTVGGTVAVGWDQQTSYMLVRRTQESEIEEHSRWDDVLLVRAGTGAIVFGPRARGARLVAPGELRGGALATRESRVLHGGDMARIPAGMPHAFVPSGDEPWELLIVKVRRPNLPLRRTAE